MAKTTKKRANSKGAVKKAAPVKAKPKKKGLRAPTKGKQRIVGGKRPLFEAQSVGRTTLDLRAEPERLTVEEQFEAEQTFGVIAIEARPPGDPAALAVPKKRFRFRDAISGLFVKLGFAKKNPTTTVRERVK